MNGLNSKQKVVLIVDDVESSRDILCDIIESMGCEVLPAGNGARALEILKDRTVDIIISDVYMPDMDGVVLCGIVKNNPETQHIPIIFASADMSGAVCDGFRNGGDDFLNKPFYPEIVKAKLNSFFELIDTKEELRDTGRRMHITVREQLKRIEEEKKNVLFALTRIVNESCIFDGKHSERLSYNCRVLSEALQLSNEFGNIISDSFIDAIETAAPLCDIGNVAIGNDILSKKGTLTDEEREIVKKHTVFGSNILEDILKKETGNDYLKMSYDIALNHHEYYGGGGYPRGISGDEIPLSAQIVAIAGTYCAMTEARPYREAFEAEEAVKMIKEKAGDLYAPFLCEVMEMIAGRLR